MWLPCRGQGGRENGIFGVLPKQVAGVNLVLIATCAYREFRPYQPASLWHANRRSRVRREKALVHSGGIPARELVRSTR
jgi:hypothetical protein